MKSKKLVIGLIALSIAVSLVNIAFTVKDSYFDNIEYLPEGEFLYSSLSPDGETTVSIYKVSGMKRSAIRGAVVSVNEQGEREERNIFWQVGTDNALSGWVDNTTISINDKEVDVLSGGWYDSRF
ncbi:MAG: hypothetical protein IKK13_03835 [Clostridia bacterium]|nr:hypothetical protein [Clostridia bacterium]